jgi:hypothetical protein
MTFYYHRISAIVGHTVFGLSGIIMAAFFMNVGSSKFDSIFSLFFLLIGSYLIIEAYSKRILIDSEGIKYLSLTRKYFMEWGKVERIDIRGLFSYRARIDAICFFTRNADYSDINIKNIGPDFIMMLNIKRKVIDEVKKYWNEEVGGLEIFNY